MWGRPTAAEAPPGQPPGLFRPQLRQLSLAWVCLSLPLVVLVGTIPTTPTGYLVVFAFFASGWYTTPALVLTWLAARRAPRPDNRCWWMWFGALVLMYGIGCAMLVGAVVDYTTPTVVNTAVVAVASVILITATVLIVRARSGRRAMSVDLIESLMSVIVVVAPAGLFWGDDVLHAEDSWYAVPSAVASVAMVFGVYWAVLLNVRLRDETRTGRAIGRCGVALAVVGLANAIGQTVQGISGFALPGALLLGLHALCMSLLVFMPLFVPDRISPGLDRLPPKDQVRGASVPAVLTLVGLPVLVATTLVLRERHDWAPLYSLAVTVVLLVLAALRHLAGVRETRRLYSQVEQAAARRRELLSQVMQRNDTDRHRVAAQLHEQAVSAYATFVSFIQTSSLAPSGPGGPVAGASEMVRDELRAQAESLRQLMLAVQPLEVDRPRSQSLVAPIRAYVDGLYGDGRAPVQAISVDDDMVLDWSMETVVLRILQEAVRNVWRHSDATHIEITVRAEGPAVVVTVADDGMGFDPSAVLFESGLAAMRSFAGLGQGTLTVESAAGCGTRVTARLGDVEPLADDVPDDVEAPVAGEAPRLRLLVGELGSVGEA
jgi:signal transduction histidine kinase